MISSSGNEHSAILIEVDICVIYYPCCDKKYLKRSNSGEKTAQAPDSVDMVAGNDNGGC